MRIGLGYDLHKLVKERQLILGAVHIPYAKGLLGNSDADVLIHAIMDALLGAMHEGNIGVLFPPEDPKWTGSKSTELLEIVYGMMKEKGDTIINIDSIIMCERPKLNPYIAEMKQNIAALLGITTEQISIKATTHEGLGPVGKGSAIAAQAICLMQERTKS